MKAFYQISSEVTGKLLLRRRKVAKALRWWLRENGIKYEYSFFYRSIIPPGHLYQRSFLHNSNVEV